MPEVAVYPAFETPPQVCVRVRELTLYQLQKWVKPAGGAKCPVHRQLLTFDFHLFNFTVRHGVLGAYNGILNILHLAISSLVHPAHLRDGDEDA